ncbi:hypothetical protein ACQP1O_16955 [Nocardia sp. CA-151230]|uniref:hypothetical protein n=1 Tax=Nocardia sp. CA-151230 TaxID=3239982 RepID=UPI003D8D1732
MTAPNLQEAIDRAGSAIRLPWQPNASRWQPAVVRPEFVGWRQQHAVAFDTMALVTRDTVVVTETGAERLGSRRRELIVVDA